MMKLQRNIYILSLLLMVMGLNAAEPFFPPRIIFTSQNYYSIYIMDQGKSDINDLASMLQFYNPTINSDKANKIAAFYVKESLDEGVNHDIAFCQMVLETGFLKYGGSVKKQQNNFCGLGATGGNVAGEHFPDMQTGVRAHIQHLKAYASHRSVNNKCIDIRFKYVKRGIAPTIYGLTGKWASDPYYDKKIEDLLHRLFSHRSLMASQLAF
ncbi:MAG: glucosaminidase domain-containing protein [Bacteroidales bacterium]|nr:glucosaminidase domain-containing protein [Bacteroidales bacterium]